jgi:hypothetical protein
MHLAEGTGIATLEEQMRFLVSLCLTASWIVAQPPAPQGNAPQDDPLALPEVRNYRLTMAKLEKWAAANRAVVPYQRDNIEKIKNKPDPPPGQAHTLDAMVQWTRKTYPEHVRLVERAGIPFKEYLIVDFALKAASGAAFMAERGQQPPPGMFINKANVEFCKANKEKITAMYAEFQQLLVGHK